MLRRCRAARRCQGTATDRRARIHRLPACGPAIRMSRPGPFALQHANRCAAALGGGTKRATSRSLPASLWPVELIRAMHEIIYLIGLVVVVMFILGLLGVR